MGALANAALVARDQTFRDQVVAGLVYRARQVLNPGPTDPAPSEFSVAYAKMVAAQAENEAERAYWVVATDSDVAAAGLTGLTEAMVIQAITRAWPYLARL